MKFDDKKILIIFIEPTPYILDLLERGFEDINEKYDVVFLSQNLTQSWDLLSRAKKYMVCPPKKKLFKLSIDIILKRKYRLVHVAGWSNLYILFLILSSRLFFYSITVESDTSFNLDLPTWKKIIKKCLYPILFKFPVYFLPGGIRQEKYLLHYQVDSKKITRAQMTVDVEYIQNYVKKISSLDRDKLRANYAVSTNDVVFLFVGRLLDWKGIRELILAFELFDHTNAKLWIVGDGELKLEINATSEKNNKIIYLGRITDDLLYQIYHAADVFVIPSHHEPWGLVVNEAMAAGLPVIATKGVGCIDDLVLHNKQGFIVPSKNISALYESMNLMFINTKERQQMAQNAAHTIQSWTLKNEAFNMMAAWKSVITRKSQRDYS